MDENKGLTPVAIAGIVVILVFAAACLCGAPSIGYLVRGM